MTASIYLMNCYNVDTLRGIPASKMKLHLGQNMPETKVI